MAKEKKNKVETVMNLLDKTLLRIICKTDEERESMKAYLIANLLRDYGEQLGNSFLVLKVAKYDTT